VQALLSNIWAASFTVGFQYDATPHASFFAFVPDLTSQNPTTPYWKPTSRGENAQDQVKGNPATTRIVASAYCLDRNFTTFMAKTFFNTILRPEIFQLGIVYQ